MKNIWVELLTPFLLLIVFVVALFGVTGLMKSLNTAPSLTITGSAEQTTDKDKIVISGKTDPGAKVTVADKAVSVAKDGSFSTEVAPAVGLNNYKVVAKKGTTIQKEVTVAITRTAPIQETATSSNPSAAIPQSTTETGNSNLASSGPVDSVFGALGLASLLASLYFYQISKKKTREPAYEVFT